MELYDIQRSGRQVVFSFLSHWY